MEKNEINKKEVRDDLKELGLMPEDIIKLIHSCKLEPSIYSAVIKDGEEVLLFIGEQDYSMYRLQSNNYYEITDYDRNGYQEAIRYEYAGE